jgi:hypothetical protein
LDAKVDTEVDSLHVKRINIEDLVGYIYIVRVDFSKNKTVSGLWSPGGILENLNHMLILSKIQFYLVLIRFLLDFRIPIVFLILGIHLIIIIIANSSQRSILKRFCIQIIIWVNFWFLTILNGLNVMIMLGKNLRITQDQSAFKSGGEKSRLFLFKIQAWQLRVKGSWLWRLLSLALCVFAVLRKAFSSPFAVMDQFVPAIKA